MINIAEILRDCPKGTKLYSPIYGEVEFNGISSTDTLCICVKWRDRFLGFSKEGRFYADSDGECLLFPSKDQRDWTKFKKEKFDPRTLKPFDRVLVRYTELERWRADFLSFVYKPIDEEMCHTIGSGPVHIAIPYNDDTKHLVGTTDDCPKYYKWWEE